MKTLVVYDSFFGNTAKVAEAIGAALAPAAEVTVVKVADVTPQHLQGVQMLFVGSPTRAFRPSPAISSFLAGLPANGLQGVRVAAFDTRTVIDANTPGFLRFMVKLFGWAAKPIAKRLTGKGGQLALTPEGFSVRESEGPLIEGEVERAAQWARGILQAS
ncbi:MAG: flavodoxin family protein [Chloroflexi bacterium]|nr:flavodoxin family protein [Chloroflexota bacterium]